MTTKSQILTFILVGGLNTLFGYTLFALFIYLGIHYSLAAFLATCLGVLFNYKTTGKLVFEHTDNKAILKFVGVNVFLYLFYTALISFIHTMVDNLYLVGFICIIPYAIFSFILNKYVVFQRYQEAS